MSADGASSCVVDNLFPADAIAWLNAYASRAGAEAGGIVQSDASHKIARDVRRSEVVWLPNTGEAQAIYGLVAELVNHINKEVFRFELEGLTEPFQLATYRAEAGGFYGWHVDTGAGRLARRKLSLIVPLTDPGEYEGGEFQVFHDSEPTPIAMPLGRVVAFPSYLLHSVSPLTRGVRRSLAVWASGPPFR